MYSISMLIQSQPIQIEPFRFFAGTLLPHVSVMTSPRRMVMLSLRVTMIVVMQFTKRNRVERMMVPSILPPPNNIYPVSPSFVATTILLFYYLMIVIGVPSKVLVGDTSTNSYMLLRLYQFVHFLCDFCTNSYGRARRFQARILVPG